MAKLKTAKPENNPENCPENCPEELAYQIKKVGANYHILTIDVANGNKVLETENLGTGYNEVNFKAKKFFVELLIEFFDENK